MTANGKINVAVLGTGMMGQEHISYMSKYPQIHVKYICDSNQAMLDKAMSMLISPTDKNKHEHEKVHESESSRPRAFHTEKELLEKVEEIDLLVIATPNYMHTPHLLRWANHPICILVEKPVAISQKQVLALRAARSSFKAKIWVAMEYRYIPAVQKLYQLLPTLGEIKNVSIRENRFPFLSKVNEWNKDVDKSGDTLVEKCCHFFDLFRLLSNQEMRSCTAKVQRGLLDAEYGYDKRNDHPHPIIDSAYVLLDFQEKEEELTDSTNTNKKSFAGQRATMGCLELCMFADGSRHQEEIVVTGLKGRVEAYLPENKVFHYTRPALATAATPVRVPTTSTSPPEDGKNVDEEDLWVDRSQPPPRSAIKEQVIDCSILSNVYSFADEIPQHAGHHYCSTAVEWKYLIDQVESWQADGTFVPQVSLEDGIAAVEMGMEAQMNISNKAAHEEEKSIIPISAFGSQSCEHLLNLAIGLAGVSSASRAHLAAMAEEHQREITQQHQQDPSQHKLHNIDTPTAVTDSYNDTMEEEKGGHH